MNYLGSPYFLSLVESGAIKGKGGRFVGVYFCTSSMGHRLDYIIVSDIAYANDRYLFVVFERNISTNKVICIIKLSKRLRPLHRGNMLKGVKN